MTSLPESFSEFITGHIQIPPREPRYGRWGKVVPEAVQSTLKQYGVMRPWLHQARAIETLASGSNVVVATGTGSGKSLVAWVPALSMLTNFSTSTSLSNHTHRPTTLYLSPTKALGTDQRTNLEQLATTLDPHITVASTDGDCDTAARRFARDYGDIVLTNPDFLHYSMLSRHTQWARLWRGLTYIVVDEFHHYRGNFGANVALILRRTLRIAAHYGAHPRIIFLSATVHNPAHAAQRFLGDAFGPVVAITEDGSPAGPRDIYTMTGSDNSYEQASDLAAELVASGNQLLTFVRSRSGTERVAELIREKLGNISPELSSHVAAYRGGYLPEERRELESQLRSGKIRALATTSALELGIDIAGLDCVVVTGWPETHASFQQQIGRAGRSGTTGLAVFIARDNPLDQFIASHPEMLRSHGTESPTFDPTNPWILPAHLATAAHELPLTSQDLPIFSLTDTKPLDDMTAADLLRQRPRGWFWNTATRIDPHGLLDLREAGHTISIVNSADGSVLGTVDAAQADTTVFPGAIYLHQGAPFEIEGATEDIVLAHPTPDTDIRTYARTETSVDIVSTTHRFILPDGQWCYGMVNVRSQVVGYDVRRVSDGVFLGTVPLELPVREFVTAGTWLTLNESLTRKTGISTANLPGALHAAEHTMIALLPLLATCDRWDIGGLSTAVHPQTTQPTIIIHDAIPGGSGAALRGFYAGPHWLKTTLETLTTCPCVDGCPSCVQSPKCGNNNNPLSKDDALLLTAAGLDQFHNAAQQWPWHENQDESILTAGDL
ncbi:DEAD/DEAH box helicase [Arcanobacterium phocae]|uniref:DEAD/DEAH box helicase n=1 Tax=Arcanobacterium phocae TaxID=131112 RepID=UPI001C0F0476|nr:DEAD/DEAH box helicase [Arcanobacterium phocae]